MPTGLGHLRCIWGMWGMWWSLQAWIGQANYLVQESSLLFIVHFCALSSLQSIVGWMTTMCCNLRIRMDLLFSLFKECSAFVCFRTQYIFSIMPAKRLASCCNAGNCHYHDDDDDDCQVWDVKHCAPSFFSWVLPGGPGSCWSNIGWASIFCLGMTPSLSLVFSGLLVVNGGLEDKWQLQVQ